MTKPLVTIITATTGSKYLENTLKSVVAQTYENIQHLVVIDGKHRQDDARRQINKWGSPNTDVVTVPYSVGTVIEFMVVPHIGHKVNILYSWMMITL